MPVRCRRTGQFSALKHVPVCPFFRDTNGVVKDQPVVLAGHEFCQVKNRFAAGAGEKKDVDTVIDLIEALSAYEDMGIPFADVLLETLKDGVQQPQTPLYNDISMAISHTLHPLRAIRPQEDVKNLRRKIERALHSEGLL